MLINMHKNDHRRTLSPVTSHYCDVFGMPNGFNWHRKPSFMWQHEQKKNTVHTKHKRRFLELGDF